ncbi:MAG: low-specificity L-threonine aldolase [Peptostreptococcaceae bacterium]|nr:low-specificity L-threonine aldolase [Peptostreptococcaceae bacterium]
MIDLRSDTVTKPTERMRMAMEKAIVGDDVYGDDPTVNELERLAAKIIGKEDSIFVPSGTFGNQLAVLTHTKRGDEVILGKGSHIFQHEVGAAAVIAGVQLRLVDDEKGYMSTEDVKEAIRKENIHYPDTGLICIENAHSNGMAISPEKYEGIRKLAKQNKIPIHMDGARVMNAAVSLGVNVKDITKYADSVMFCLSKGLGAPIGSMLAGDKEFVKRARKYRKLMGGGMRQVGVIAAPGILALIEMVDRLQEDHDNAKVLASKLDAILGIEVKHDRNDINMVYCKIPNALIKEEKLVKEMKKNGIIINGEEKGEYRFVTNKDVSREDLDVFMKVIEELTK